MSVDDAPVSAARRARGERSRSVGGRSAICFETDDDDGERRRVRLDASADPSDADSITTSTPDAREYTDALPKLPLSGSGPEYDTCGDDIPALSCIDCGDPKYVGSTCRRSRCPRCWEAWAFYRTVEAVTAVDGTRRKRASEPGPNPYNHHVIVSFPDGTRFNSDDALDRGYAAVKRLMAEVGGDTGMIVYHPYRIAEEHRGDVLGHSSGDGELRWKDVLDMTAEERADVLVHSPHFHVFAVSDFIQGGAVTADIEDKSGVVIERIADDDGVSLADLEALAAATAYSLTHTGLTSNDDDDAYRAAYRYFGETANIDRRENVRSDVTEALRTVAYDVLGVDFSRRNCENRILDIEAPAAGESIPTTAQHSPVLESAESADSGPSSLDTVGGNTGGFAADSSGPQAPQQGVKSVAADTRDMVGHDHDDGDECGGDLVPIWTAPERLADDEWRESIPDENAEKLRKAYNEWVEMGAPVPEGVQSGPPDDPEKLPPD